MRERRIGRTADADARHFTGNPMDLLAARALMGVSLAFHIVYATIGIGLPLMLMLAEGLALKTGDDAWRRLARRWIRPAGVLFAIGAVS